MNKVILQLATYALRGLLGGMTLLGALLLTATATDVPIARAGPGQTSLGPCIDDLFPGALGCTANDVRISGIADVTGDGIVDGDDITFKPLCDAGSLNAGANCAADPAVCLDKHGVPTPELCGDRCAFPGDLTSFAATFEIEMNAQERYDIGLFFAVDGDPNGDGALTGTCSISTLPEAGMFERPDGTSDSFVDLDSTCKGGGCPQPQDLCGDVVEAINPIFYDLSSNGSFISAWCIDLDGNDMLNLPNCTSWRQSGANEVCLLPTDAYPGSPSKCNCDTTFEVPINIPPAELEVLKTATPTQVDEPAGTVQFSLSVTNTGVDPNNHVALHTLVDDVYGDLDADAADPAWLSSTCLAGGGPVTITAGGTYTCVFTASVEGGGGSWHVDTVTAMGLDSRDNEISGEDDAAVEVLDLMPQIEVIKSASPTSVVEGSNTPVTFTVEVVNTSPADSVTLVSLTDDIYGELVNCPLPATIPVGESYVCSFTVVVDGPANSIETDTVTAVGMDDEGNPAIASDSATVTVLDDPATIELIKVANPTEVNEPGDDVTYTFTVQNLSSVDAVTITTLDDDIWGSLNDLGDCGLPQVMPPLGSYTCTVTMAVLGNAHDVVTNVATASGVDDDGKVLFASDSATVNILDVPPAASLTKVVTKAIVTYHVTVSNDSPSEVLELESLWDDQFGAITQVAGDIVHTTCMVPQTIAVGGSYACSFDAFVVTSPHVDIVTGTLWDDEGSPVSPSDSATVTLDTVP